MRYLGRKMRSVLDGAVGFLDLFLGFNSVDEINDDLGVDLKVQCCNNVS